MSVAQPLIIFAAGMLTIASPCVLPVLPIILGTAVLQDKRAPLALCAGLTLSFACTGALLAVSAAWIGSFTSSLRFAAIFLLLIFGIITAFPTLGTRIFGTLGLPNLVRSTKARGMIGAFVVGTQLGLVWSPCAGPILAGVLTLAAVGHDAAGSFSLLLCYGLGASIPMLLLAYGGRRCASVARSLQPYAASVQRIGGTLIALSAVAILLGWDQRIEDALLPFFPHVI